MAEPSHPEVIILNAALEIPPAERGAYLDLACADNAGLRQQVETLLNAHEEAGGFLETAPTGLDRMRTLAVRPPLVGKPGDAIGRYKLLQQIGEGGCGVVYMAEQEEPVRRRVALKVIKLGMDTKQVIARFEAERQALALMDHPNIAKVLDAGATNTGRPYFVMELVRGIKITDFCDESRLSTPDRLKLFMQVCQAIQHAHQKGVIHRDIKPSNILVTINDGVPVPKVIDFGIAKATAGRLTDHTLFTAFEQFIGTPAYMSPEQAVMTSLDIDTRSDIYSLGVLLYELLTGRTPFDQKELLAAGLDEMRRTIREHEPLRPSAQLSTLAADSLTTTAAHRRTEAPKLIHTLRGDLDWIAMKCLEKDRGHRYETANGLARDVERYLGNEPILARPPSGFYKLQKLVRRNKLVFTAGVGISAALIIGFGIALWQSIEKTRAYRVAQAEKVKSQHVSRLLKEMLDGVGPSVALGRDTVLLREILDKTAQRVDQDLANAPEAAIEIRTTLASVYGELGLFEQMEETARKNLEMARAIFRVDNAALGTAYFQLGDAQRSRARLTEAEGLLREALRIQRRVLGNDDLEIARTLRRLGNVFHGIGKSSEAEAAYREGLSICAKNHGKSTIVEANLLDALSIEIRKHRAREAEELSRRSLEIKHRVLGEHPEVGRALEALALVLNDQGKFAEAEAISREAVVLDQKVFGHDHYHLASALSSLGVALGHQGQWAAAEKVLHDAAVMRTKTLGHDRIEVTYSLYDLGQVLENEGKFAEAETCYREVLAIRQNIKANMHGSEHLWLATTLARQGKVMEAKGTFRDGLVVCQNSTDSPVAYNNMAWTMATSPYTAFRDASNAIVFAKKAVAALGRTNVISLDTLAAAYAEAGLFEQAIETQKEALAFSKHEWEKKPCTAHLRSYKSALPLREDPIVASQAGYAWKMATSVDPKVRNGAVAVRFAEYAVLATSRKNLDFLDTLAAAYAESGLFEQAVSAEKEVTALLGDEPTNRDFTARLRLYESKTPFRERN